MSGLFVGRAEELGALRTLVAGVRDRPAVALVLGDPGSGKTRLLREAAGAADVERRFALVGYEPERAVPLAAAVPLLRRLEHGAAGTALRRLLLEERGALEPVRVFEAALRAFLSHARTLLVLDDVQWLDHLSLALCHYLVRGADAEARPVAVLAAARPSAQADLLRKSLAAALGGDRVVEVELEPLDDAAATALLLALAPGLDAEALERRRARAAGSPFWLEALARSEDVAADAHRLLASRLHGAGPDAVALLSLLVVAARPLSQAEAATVLEWPESRASAATADLVAHGVAVRRGALLHPAHDVIREAAARDLPERERRELHRRLAAHLDAVADGDLRLLREALEHRLAAKLPALELAERLARSPQRTLLGTEGLRALTAISETAGRQSGRLGLELARLALELGAFAEADRLGRGAAARLTGPERAEALLVAARATYESQDRERTRELLVAARSAAGGDRALTLETDAFDALACLWMEGRQQEGQRLARAAASRSRRLVEAVGGPPALSARERRACAAALEAAVGAAMQGGRHDELLRLVDEEEALSEGPDVSTVFHRTFGLRHGGRYREAEAAARQAWHEANRRVLPHVALEAGCVLGQTLLELGRLEQSERIAAEVAPLGARLGATSYRVPAVARLQAELEIVRGDWRHAVARLVANAEEMVDPHYRIGDHEVIALALARVGDARERGEVAARLELARADADRAGCPRCAAQLRLVSAYALAKTGRVREARRAYEEWRLGGRVAAVASPYLQLRAEGAIAAAEGASSAAEVLRAARLEVERLGLRVEAIWQSLDEAEVLERDVAIRTLRAAAEAAEEIGSRTQLELARQRLRAHGVRSWRRGRALNAPLTAREHEVARLVATGATNPEIAARLFLSRKTVEHHVSHAMRKLGARNRAELAARLATAPAPRE